MHDPERCLCHC
ncbi:hypothetical protein EFR42_05880 [Lactobacillus delbrueckii]|nr:hypothetical protein [Lactobacillus delbrueckii]MCT3492109.1 hypothetical protein [Lactobacillus delbrueckii]